MDLSYCIPSYQRFESACRAVDSCLKEITNGAKAEVLLLDDASPDDTGKKLVARYRSQKNVRVMARAKNIGLVANWNDGLRRAKGRWIQFLGDDDQVAIGSAKIMLNAAAQNDGVAFLFSGFKLIDEQSGGGINILPLRGRQGRLHGGHLWAWVAAYFNPITLCTVLFDKKRLLDQGGFQKKAWYAADGDSYLRLLSEADAFYVDRPLALNGWSGSNLQAGMKDSRTSEALRAVAEFAALPAGWQKIPGARVKLGAFLVGRHAADSMLRWRLAKNNEAAAKMQRTALSAQRQLPQGPWQRPMNLARLSDLAGLRFCVLGISRLIWRARRRYGWFALDPEQCFKMLDQLFDEGERRFKAMDTNFLVNEEK